MKRQTTMKSLLLCPVLALTSLASAAPLLGTKAPFSTTPFCKTHGCELTSKQTLATGWTEYRYTLAPFRPSPKNEIPVPGETLSVIRAGEVMKGVGLVMGAQDLVFWEGSPLTRMWLEVIFLTTGRKFTEKQLVAFEEACNKVYDREHRVALGAFTLSCLYSGGELGNAARVSMRVYQ